MTKREKTREGTRRGRSGFTLLELLITVFILGVVAAIAVPSFRSQLVHYRFDGYSKNLQTMLRTAYFRAISTGYQHRIEINTSSGDVALQRGNASSGSTSWFPAESTLSAPAGGNPIDHIVNTVSCADAGMGGATVTIIFNPNSTTDGRVICLRTSSGDKRIDIIPGTSRVFLKDNWT